MIWVALVQVASSAQPGSTEAEPKRQSGENPDSHLHMDWPAGPADDEAAADNLQLPRDPSDAESSHLGTTFPPNLPGLLTTHTRSGSEELNLHEAESSRASSRIPAHSALSRMLQESSAHEQGLEEGSGWSLGAAAGIQEGTDVALFVHTHNSRDYGLSWI